MGNPDAIGMTDAETVALLDMLAKYASEYGGEISNAPAMTVRELAGDLVDSLPRSLEPREAIGAIERVFGRDALTGSAPRRYFAASDPRP